MKKIYFFLPLVAFYLFSCSEDTMDELDVADGVNSLISVVEEPSGENCPAGGFFVRVGQDENANDNLDSAEVSFSTFVCNGENGADGAAGQDGMNAEQIMVITSDEPAGSNCPEGGIKIEVGYDSDESGTLNASEIMSTSFVCNGESSTREGGNNGKTYVILKGNLSKEEAQNILARDLGPNTQFITVENTKEIDSLDFSVVTSLVDLTISNNRSLVHVNLSNLKQMNGDMVIENNPNWRVVNFPALEQSFGRLEFGTDFSDKTQRIDTIKLEKLRRVPSEWGVSVRLDTVQSLQLPALTSGSIGINGVVNTLSRRASIVINELQFTDQLIVPELSISISNITEGPDYDFPFEEIGLITEDNCKPNFSIANLVKGAIRTDNNFKTSGNFSLPNFETGGVSIYVSDYNEINLPRFSSGSFSLSGNDTISNLNLSSLDSGSVSISAFSGGSGNNTLEIADGIELPEFVKGDLSIRNFAPLLTTPKFEEGRISIVNTTYSSLSFPVFKSGNVVINNNSQLTEINFPELATVSGISITDNNLLTSLALPSFTGYLTGLEVPGFGFVEFDNIILDLQFNSFTETTLNQLLVDFDQATPLKDVPVSLQINGYGPPSGDGITALESLRNKGIEVSIDQ